MSKHISHSILWLELNKSFRIFYPYFLSLYLLSLIVAYFFKPVSSFFYWPAFHLVAIMFTLFFLISIVFVKAVPVVIFQTPKITFHKKIIDKMNRTDWLKISFIGLVLLGSLFIGIGILNFLVLFFGLVVVTFAVDNRWSAGMALFFLLLCPVFLLFSWVSWAENSAIFAYYFLIIHLLSQLHRAIREKNKI